jgi:hypothetical protein
MSIPLNASSLRCVLSALLVMQLAVLAARFGAWQRFRKWQETGEMPGSDPRLVPQTQRQAVLPVISSGYGSLVMAGGLLAIQIVPASTLRVMLIVLIAYLPALLADPILFFTERMGHK